MIDYSSPDYNEVSNMIYNRLKEGESVESIKAISEKNLKAINAVMACDIRSVEDWIGLVDHIFERYFEGFSHDSDSPRLEKLPDWPKSSWRAFINGLKGPESEMKGVLRKDVVSITSKLVWDTGHKANRLLVVGDARSGKTLNILGLVNAAFDHGWNLVVYFMGRSSYGLNNQTKRLVEGVFSGQQEYTTRFSELGHADMLPHGNGMNFNKGPNRRILLYGLRNISNIDALKRLLDCNDECRKSIRALIIEERDLRSAVDHKFNIDSTEEQAISAIIDECCGDSPVSSINYVVYTSACYDTLLKKNYLTTIMPIDSIVQLSRGDKYLSTDDLFPQSDTKNRMLEGFIVTDTDVDRDLIRLYSDPARNPPASLERAIAWGLCANAVCNHLHQREPCTMLISCDVMDIHVTSLTVAVFKTLEADNLIELCKSVYKDMVGRICKEAYVENFPSTDATIQDYPPFEEISPLIQEALSNGPYRYSELQRGKKRAGTIVCYDTERVDEHYSTYCPDKYIENLCDYRNPIMYRGHLPLYILIAFRNISRGLEIRKLVSTYMAKTADKTDPNIPIGLWAGRHAGYELLPRAWMSDSTREYYVKLNELENRTRSFIRSNAIRWRDDLPMDLLRSLDSIHFNTKSYEIMGKRSVCATCGRMMLKGEICYSIPGPTESWRCYECQFPASERFTAKRGRISKSAEAAIPLLLSSRMVSSEHLIEITNVDPTRLTNQLKEMGYVVSVKKEAKKFDKDTSKGTYYELICCPEMFRFFDRLAVFLRSEDYECLHELYDDYNRSWIWMLERLMKDILEIESSFEVSVEHKDYVYRDRGYPFFEKICNTIRRDYPDILTGDRARFHYVQQAPWIAEELERKNRDSLLLSAVMKSICDLEDIEQSGDDTIIMDGHRVKIAVQSNKDRLEYGTMRQKDLLSIYVGSGEIRCVTPNHEVALVDMFPQMPDEYVRELRMLTRLIDEGF